MSETVAVYQRVIWRAGMKNRDTDPVRIASGKRLQFAIEHGP